jgi:PAS domain S-box-containing protein
MTSSQHLPLIEDTELVLEELFRHTPVGVVLTDLYGTVIDANDALCAMVGYARAEMVSRKFTDFSHPDDLADVQARTSDLREGRTGHSGSYARNSRR